jgi:hypothetical protein
MNRKSKVSDLDNDINSAVFILTAPCSERSAINRVSTDWKFMAAVHNTPHEISSEQMNKTRREKKDFIWPKIENK